MHYSRNLQLKNNFNDKAVFIVGGTRGIGFAAALEFGRLGAQLYLTHRWGSADESEILKQFREVGAPEPIIFEADVSIEAENATVIKKIHADGFEIEVYLNCACVVTRGNGLEKASLRALRRSMNYSTWPFIGLLKLIKKHTGTFPGYSIAITSDGHLSHYPGYDYVASSKAVLEAITRQYARSLYKDNSRINIIRTRSVLTDGYAEIFAESDRNIVTAFDQFTFDPKEIANCILAICSGYLDAMSGEVVVVDKGASIVDNIMTLGPDILEHDNG